MGTQFAESLEFPKIQSPQIARDFFLCMFSPLVPLWWLDAIDIKSRIT